jgi:hypothetical protein
MAQDTDDSWARSYPCADPELHPCALPGTEPGQHFSRGSHFLHPTYTLQKRSKIKEHFELVRAAKHPTQSGPLDPAVLDHYVPSSHYYFLHGFCNPDLCNCLVVRRPGHELSRELAVWSQSQAVLNLKFLHARGGRWVFALEVCRRGAKTYWESFDWWDLRGILRVPANHIERLILPKVPQNLRPGFCMAFGFHVPAFGVLEYCFQPLKHRTSLRDLMRKPSPEDQSPRRNAKKVTFSKLPAREIIKAGVEEDKENVQPNKAAESKQALYVFEDLGEEYLEMPLQKDSRASSHARSRKAYVISEDGLKTEVAPLKRVSFPRSPIWTEEERVAFLQ